ncbi:G2/mitotic-specific cyclin-1, partial [Capsicum chinense]
MESFLQGRINRLFCGVFVIMCPRWQQAREMQSLLDLDYTTRGMYDVFVNFIKAACCLSKKPKKQIMDIDVADVNNELAILEYVEDIYGFYKLSEPANAVYPNEATDQLGSRQHNKVFDCS